MREFQFENQGANTYLIYQFAENEGIDTMSLGMLTNNHISGLASAVYYQLDEVRAVKYNITAKVSLDQFFTGVVNKKRVLGVLNGIIQAMSEMEDYMMNPETIVIDPKYMFVNVTTCEMALISIPTTELDEERVNLGAFFKDLVFTAPKEESLKEYKEQGIQTAIANFNDPEGLVKVFENADKVLLISMPFVGEKRRQAHKNAVDACVKANVKQIIYTSVLSAAHPFNPSIENVDHSYTEAIIQNTSLDYIFLRNSLFVEAFTSDYLRAVEAKETTISKNMGDGRVWFISRKDCAYAAACALNNHLLHRAVLNINGLEPLSYGDFLAIGNKATGNHITYTRLTDDELYAYFDSIGVPRNTDGDFSKSPIKATSEGMVTFGTTVTQGYLDVPVSDFSSLTGRKPLSIQYIFEHVDDYLLGDRHPTE